MSLAFEDFERLAQPAMMSPNSALYWAVGLGGEAGELLNVVKKLHRDGGSAELDVAMLDEAGDVLFYLTRLLEHRGLTLEGAAERCLLKLERKRAEAGR